MTMLRARTRKLFARRGRDRRMEAGKLFRGRRGRGRGRDRAVTVRRVALPFALPRPVTLTAPFALTATGTARTLMGARRILASTVAFALTFAFTIMLAGRTGRFVMGWRQLLLRFSLAAILALVRGGRRVATSGA
jgi:hypothetical protein